MAFFTEWSCSYIVLALASITVSGDMRFSQLMVFTCFKLKAAVEAEVKIFHKSNVETVADFIKYEELKKNS